MRILYKGAMLDLADDMKKLAKAQTDHCPICGAENVASLEKDDDGISYYLCRCLNCRSVWTTDYWCKDPFEVIYFEENENDTKG